MNREDNVGKAVTVVNVRVKKMVLHLAPGSSRQTSPDSGSAFASGEVAPAAINKVLIPGIVRVVHPESPEGGIPLRLTEKGVLPLLVDPWLVFNDGDSVDILDQYDLPRVGKTIQGDPPVRFGLDYPSGFLREGINKLRVRVTRTSQPEPETSLPCVVLYHAHRPGGDVAGIGDNLNLTLSLPADVIANGVDAARAAQGVPLTLSYQYMRERDLIALDLHGHYPEHHSVTAAEAAARAVTLTLFTADFVVDDKKFAIRYSVTDQITNSSGPLAIWSKATYIDVHIKAPSLNLVPPKVLEAREANGTVLNFEKDFYEAKFATVEVNYPGSAPGQTVKVYLEGRAYTYGSEIQTVAYAGQTLRFQVPRIEIVDCIHTSKNRVWYTVRLPGTHNDIPSQVLPLSINGQKHKLETLSYDNTTRKLTAVHKNLEAPYTVRMRLHGVVVRDGDEQQVSFAQSSLHDVEQAWLDENRGRTIVLNFSIRRTHTLDPINFSWCIRIKV